MPAIAIADLLDILKQYQSVLISQNFIHGAKAPGILANLDRVNRMIFKLEKLQEHQRKMLNGSSLVKSESGVRT